MFASLAVMQEADRLSQGAAYWLQAKVAMAACLCGLQELVLHSLEGLAEGLRQRACQDILGLPQPALLRLDGITCGQLLLRGACMQ